MVPGDVKWDPNATPPQYTNNTDTVIEKGSQLRLKIMGTRSDVGSMFAIGSIKEDYLGYSSPWVVLFPYLIDYRTLWAHCRYGCDDIHHSAHLTCSRSTLLGPQSSKSIQRLRQSRITDYLALCLDRFSEGRGGMMRRIWGSQDSSETGLDGKVSHNIETETWDGRVRFFMWSMFRDNRSDHTWSAREVSFGNQWIPKSKLPDLTIF